MSIIESVDLRLISFYGQAQRTKTGNCPALALTASSPELAGKVLVPSYTKDWCVVDPKEVAELRRDRDRLDWLEKKDPQPYQPYYDNGKWRIPYLMSGDGGFGGGVVEATADSLRAAIDAARAGKAATCPAPHFSQ